MNSNVNLKEKKNNQKIIRKEKWKQKLNKNRLKFIYFIFQIEIS